MYRGIAHAGLSRNLASRHVSIQLKGCCRQLSCTAALSASINSPGKAHHWQFRGTKKNRRKGMDNLKKEQDRLEIQTILRGLSKKKLAAKFSGHDGLGRAKKADQIQAWSPKNIEDIEFGDKTSLKPLEEPLDEDFSPPEPPKPARSKYDPFMDMALQEHMEQTVSDPPPPKRRLGNSPLSGVLHKEDWHRTNGQWSLETSSKRTKGMVGSPKQHKGPNIIAVSARDEDGEWSSPGKRPLHEYSPLEPELEPWGGERSEFELQPQPSEPEYSGQQPVPRIIRQFDNMTGTAREVTVLKKPARDLPYRTDTSEFLYGYNICKMALKEKRRRIHRLYCYIGLMRKSGSIEREATLTRLAQAMNIEVKKTMDITLLDAMSRGRPHNGFVLEAEPLEIPTVQGLGEPDKAGIVKAPLHQSTQYVEIKTKRDDRRPFVLILDELLDGGNLGAILRSAYFLGVDAVFLVSKNSTPATAVTSRSSAGALEAIDLYEIRSLTSFIEFSKFRGWKFFGAMPSPSQRELKLSKHKKKPSWFDMEGLGDPLSRTPVALVMGNEADGLRPSIQEVMNAYVTIRKGDHVDDALDSLNVGVAASILTHAFLNPAMKGAAPMPALDKRSHRREGVVEEVIKRKKRNLMFTMDDGKYQAPRYEGTTLLKEGSSGDLEEEGDDGDEQAVEFKDEDGDWNDEDDDWNDEDGDGKDEDEEWDDEEGQDLEEFEDDIEDEDLSSGDSLSLDKQKMMQKEAPKKYQQEELDDLEENDSDDEDEDDETAGLDLAKLMAKTGTKPNPALKKRLGHMAEELGMDTDKSVYTKKEKKLLKKEGKEKSKALRKKVREDKTALISALHQGVDPKILMKIQKVNPKEVAKPEKEKESEVEWDDIMKDGEGKKE